MTASRDTNRSDKIVFFGSSDFSLSSLDVVAKLTPELLIVTHAPTPVGRKQILTVSPVAVRAKNLGLEVLEVNNLRDVSMISRLKTFAAPIGVCASFGMIFPADFLKPFPNGIVNVHPSLLPRYRGPSPVQWTIHKGDIETGVTLFLIDEQVDHGPIIAQERLAVPSGATTPELMNSLAQLAAMLLERTLPHYLAGEIKLKPQDHSAATVTPILTRDTGRINWATDDATQIERNIRAFTPWPGVWTTIQVRGTKVLKILHADPVILSGSEGSPSSREKPGTITLLNNRLAIQTIHGLLSPTMLQLEGGKPLDTASFLRGHPDIVRAQLV